LVQSEELKFCTVCGANVGAALQAVAGHGPEEKFDWSRTWVAEMFMGEEERKRRKEEMQRQRGITPEIKRYNEIKAGVIVSSVGIAISIFLFVFMGGLIASGKIDAAEAEILSRIWIAGVIPLFVGIALMINGLVVSKKLVEAAKRDEQPGPEHLAAGPGQPSLRPADTNEFARPFSVTEQTTKHLGRSGDK
jgi:hypothetical protein